MDPHFHEWLNLIVRWIHAVTGIAWIGTSFYFNWLDSNLTPPDETKDGETTFPIQEELWLVHSGGFYHINKMPIIPKTMSKTLHWFKWEAYATWISGFSLLVIVYYMGGGVYLTDSNVSDISTPYVIMIGVGTLIVSWIVYDLLCLSPLGGKTIPFTIVSFILITAIAYGLSQVFSSRGAYIHVGAIIGTVMAFNVWRRIIPAQHQLIDAPKSGKEPDISLGIKAKQRSLHNNYLTLPLLFIMVSNHYPSTFGHQYNWGILAGIALIGGVVRHFFNQRNKGHFNAWLLVGAFAGMIALAFITKPDSVVPTAKATTDKVPFRTVNAIMVLRCTSCHSANPTSPIFKTAPKNIKFDTPEEIHKMKDQIRARVVSAQTMPLGNITKMTQEERDMVGIWIDQGAHFE